MAVSRQHEDSRLRKLLADGAGGVEPLSLLRRRHPDVDHRQVRLVLADQRKELLGIAGLTHHLEPRPLEQAREALPEQDVVIGERDARSRHRDDYL